MMTDREAEMWREIVEDGAYLRLEYYSLPWWKRLFQRKRVAQLRQRIADNHRAEAAMIEGPP